MKGLRDKTVLVTGAASGIGQAVALRFAAEGARLVINYRTSGAETATVAMAQRAGAGGCIAVAADVSREAEVVAMFDTSLAEFGPLDVLVNNAGIQLWARIGPLLPTDTRGMARVDDRRVLSGIVHALRNGGRWADCPREVYGPKKTLYNRFVRWAERGIWERIFSALAGGEDAPDRLFIDSTCIKVHRCAGGGKGGPWPMASAAPRGAATPSSTLSAMRKAGPSPCS